MDHHYLRIIKWTERDEESGCLTSLYSTGSHGYAQAWNGTTVVLAHRVVWEHHHGPIPAGMTVDHICHNKRCIEIEHLRMLTNLDNARRNGPGDWPLDGRCKNGHPASSWRPKSPTNMKGYCHDCRMVIQRRRRAEGRAN